MARSLTDVLKAWQLVHQSYVQRKVIEANDEQLYTVPEAIGPHAAVMLGRIGPVCVSTLTACVDQARGLALDHWYPRELEAIRAAGRRLCEISLSADRREHLHRGGASLLALMRYAVHYAMYQQTDDTVIGVHRKHAPFYRWLIGFRPAGGERLPGGGHDKATVLLRLDLREAPDRSPLPSGLRYCLEHPVPNDQFEQRLRLSPQTIAGTPIESFAHGQNASGHPKTVATRPVNAQMHADAEGSRR